jgi:GNAT superfamily N-acetyltransferase
MAIVLQMCRRLDARPELPVVPGVGLRTFRGDNDIERWLAIREQAFAHESPPVRKWNAADFRAEFLDKPWWQPDCQWFAESVEPADPIGTLTLAMRGSGGDARPVIHWLAVVPQWRRRGVGRLLTAALERYCWDTGFREVRLETHENWKSAVAFYRKLGYTVATS